MSQPDGGSPPEAVASPQAGSKEVPVVDAAVQEADVAEPIEPADVAPDDGAPRNDTSSPDDRPPPDDVAPADGEWPADDASPADDRANDVPDGGDGTETVVEPIPGPSLAEEPAAGDEVVPVAAGPQTVGRYVASALRAAGRPLCLHGAGRVVPGTPRRVRGRRDPCRRDASRRGGRLHGRGPWPAHRTARRLCRDAGGGWLEPRHRDPYRPPGLDADVRPRRSGRAGVPWPRGVPGDRPGGHARRPRQVGGRAAGCRRGPRRARAGRPRGPRWPTGPRAAVLAGGPPRRGGRPRAGRPDPAERRPTDGRGDPHGDRTPRVRGAPCDPCGGGHPARQDLDRAAPVRRAAPCAGHRRVAARGRHLERAPPLPRDGGPQCAAIDPGASRDG